ncbi:transglutaminase-like cysteine peptidase [Bradyrhizobium sp. 2TAF24]|uniref:transglutaminase-like cysteine peptidase n=1 Tax=Bradyrhizobium sp. 2TAF24 TaxID=3233011 RepID=UPI003F92817D
MSRVAFCRLFLSVTVALLCAANGVRAADTPGLYVRVGAHTSAPPTGWVQFCQTYARECETQRLQPRDIILTDDALSDLRRLNDWVNHHIKPMTDREHYGMVQWWRYPDDGAGACHSYALLKRRLLIEAGWPRQALLMTIVRQTNGEGHAVLTVKTDRGEYILDNLTDEVLLWSKTPYGYHKRQSQDDPNQWVWLDETRADMTATSTRLR